MGGRNSIYGECNDERTTTTQPLLHDFTQVDHVPIHRRAKMSRTGLLTSWERRQIERGRKILQRCIELIGCLPSLVECDDNQDAGQQALS